VVDLVELGSQLDKLHVTRSIAHLSEVLSPPGTAVDENSKRWGQLRELKAPHNYIVNLDEAMVRIFDCLFFDCLFD
jgi:hypothetical protein